MKIVTVIGARPHFINAWPMSHELRARGIAEYVVYTGQHYDHKMSDVFFAEFGMSDPDVNLVAQQVVSLPMHANLNKADQQRIATMLTQAIG